jgi:ankyrin repeat protein
MKHLPERSNLEHLKKQAKKLLRLYNACDRTALARFREALPAAAGKSDTEISAMALRLHDAQSCIAREYSFPSWEDLKSYVESQIGQAESLASRLVRWLRLVYPGDTSGSDNRASPSAAARVLQEHPDLIGSDPYLGCAVGDEGLLQKTLEQDRSWINQAGGPLKLPPLVAVTHSSLVRLPGFKDRLHRCARLLLEAGADPNQSIGNRWPPGSLERPQEENPLSALYGAAGQHHDPELTRLLLAAGANPNDGESLYHSLDDPTCTRLLLEAGARVIGSNAFYRVFDFDNLRLVELLLAFGADPDEPALGPPTSDFGTPLMWAIRRRRSAEHIATLLKAGASPFTKTQDGVSAYRLALQLGLPEIAQLLAAAGAADEVSVQEQLIAACARGDEAAAREFLSGLPDLLTTLAPKQLRLLPDLAGEGASEAVRLMVRLGWPIAVRGGDWQASALNLAVFRGDTPLAEFLLEHGASWTEQHGYGGNVCGTLGWASCNEPTPRGDWLGCARALRAHGMPAGQPDATMPGCMLIDGHRYRFSEEVTDFLTASDHPGDTRTER